jgi:hypothetical protein
MSPRKKASQGIPVPVTITADTLAALKVHEGLRVKATGQPCSTQDAMRQLVWIGLETVKRCLSCSAGLPCSLHEPPPCEPEESAAIEGWQSVVDRYFRLFAEAGRGEPIFEQLDRVALQRFIRAVGGAKKAIAFLDKAASIPFLAATVTAQSLAKDPSRALQGNVAGPQRRPASIQRDSGFRGQDGDE